MVRRTAEQQLRALARRHPVVTLTGPRQSGKTTLTRQVFRGKPYVSLEAPDVREYALRDPRGFLGEFPRGAVIDEVQNVPSLVSYLQGIVDEDPAPGRFILTGSQNLALQSAVSQSLAGRTALMLLLPLGREEVERFPKHPSGLFDSLLAGGYPAIHQRRPPPSEWLADYIATYLERDVRRLLGVADLLAFQRFLRLAAAHSAQLINFSRLAADAGMSHNTASAWLGVLEASYIVMRLPAFHGNVGKRIVKAPKLCFLDSGLLAWLLGIRDAEQLRHHPLRGAVFESWVASEVVKAQAHHGQPVGVEHYRDRHGTEVDLVAEAGQARWLIEAKSGETVGSDFFDALARVAPLVEEEGRRVERIVVYGGEAAQRRSQGRVIPWSKIAQVDWARGVRDGR